MNIKEYNTIYYPAHNKAVSFVHCLDHALEKCDDNARMQLDVIGWDEQTKNLLLHALYMMDQKTKDVLKYENTQWWAEEVRKLKEIQDAENNS